MPLAHNSAAQQLQAYRTSTDVPADLKALDWLRLVVQAASGDEFAFNAYDINGALLNGAGVGGNNIEFDGTTGGSPQSLLALIRALFPGERYEDWATLEITSVAGTIYFAPAAQVDPIGDVRDGAISILGGFAFTTSGIDAHPTLAPGLIFGYAGNNVPATGRIRQASVIRAEANLTTGSTANHAFEVVQPEADLFLQWTPNNASGVFTYRIDRVGPTFTVQGTPVAVTGPTGGTPNQRVEGLTPGRYNLFVQATGHPANNVSAVLESFNMR